MHVPIGNYLIKKVPSEINYTEVPWIGWMSKSVTSDVFYSLSRYQVILVTNVVKSAVLWILIMFH